MARCPVQVNKSISITCPNFCEHQKNRIQSLYQLPCWKDHGSSSLHWKDFLSIIFKIPQKGPFQSTTRWRKCGGRGGGGGWVGLNITTRPKQINEQNITARKQAMHSASTFGEFLGLTSLTSLTSAMVFTCLKKNELRIKK